MGVLAIIILLIIIITVYVLYSYHSKNNYLITTIVDQVYKKSHGIINIPRPGITCRTFSITGSHNLPADVNDYVWKELKAGDELKLIPDQNNRAGSEEIKVFHKNMQIGWLRGDIKMKAELYKVLIKGKPVKAMCISNIRGPEFKRSGEKIKYLGLRQFINAKYEYET